MSSVEVENASISMTKRGGGRPNERAQCTHGSGGFRRPGAIDDELAASESAQAFGSGCSIEMNAIAVWRNGEDVCGHLSGCHLVS